MKLTWWDEGKTKVLVELGEGETLMELVGPGSFQVTGSDLAALQEGDDAPEIEDAPVPEEAAASKPKAAKADHKAHAGAAPHKGDKPA